MLSGLITQKLHLITKEYIATYSRAPYAMGHIHSYTRDVAVPYMSHFKCN